MSEELKTIAPKVVAVIAWLLCTFLMLADILVIREATTDVLTLVQVTKAEAAPEGQYHMVRIEFGSVIEQVDRTILVAGAVAISMLSVYVEHFFRMGVKKEDLIRRVLIVFGILIPILVIGVGIQTFV